MLRIFTLIPVLERTANALKPRMYTYYYYLRRFGQKHTYGGVF